MKLFRKDLLCGGALPPFYYGYSYKDWCKDIEHYHPIPINYIIRLAIIFKYLWDKFRSKPSRIDTQIFYGIYGRVLRDTNNDLIHGKYLVDVKHCIKDGYDL